MSPSHCTPSFDGWRVLVLHRPHGNVDALLAQCSRIGICGAQAWPTLDDMESMTGFDALLVDADMGHDEQFPWQPGQAPMPIVALIGSEAPGRIAWALGHGADAQLLKPIGSAGLYSALVVARQGFARRRDHMQEIAALSTQLSMRQVIAEATATLMLRHNCSADEAYHRLRKTAMSERRPIEDAAAGVLAAPFNDGLKNVTGRR